MICRADCMVGCYDLILCAWAGEVGWCGKEWRTFLGISLGFGLTKRDFGCILYDIGSIWSRCSPQNMQSDEENPEGWSDAGAKNFRKIFAKAFDKAQNCAIVYITRSIRRLL